MLFLQIVKPCFNLFPRILQVDDPSRCLVSIISLWAVAEKVFVPTEDISEFLTIGSDMLSKWRGCLLGVQVAYRTA